MVACKKDYALQLLKRYIWNYKHNEIPLTTMQKFMPRVFNIDVPYLVISYIYELEQVFRAVFKIILSSFLGG